MLKSYFEINNAEHKQINCICSACNFFFNNEKPNDSCTITYTLTVKKVHFLNAWFFFLKKKKEYGSKQIVSSTFSFCLGKSVVG